MARIHEEQEREEKNVETAQEGLRENPHSKNSTNRLKSARSHLEALKKREDEPSNCGKNAVPAFIWRLRCSCFMAKRSFI